MKRWNTATAAQHNCNDPVALQTAIIARYNCKHAVKLSWKQRFCTTNDKCAAGLAVFFLVTPGVSRRGMLENGAAGCCKWAAYLKKCMGTHRYEMTQGAFDIIKSHPGWRDHDYSSALSSICLRLRFVPNTLVFIGHACSFRCHVKAFCRSQVIIFRRTSSRALVHCTTDTVAEADGGNVVWVLRKFSSETFWHIYIYCSLQFATATVQG